jgi:hypothetical protein
MCESTPLESLILLLKKFNKYAHLDTAYVYGGTPLDSLILLLKNLINMLT